LAEQLTRNEQARGSSPLPGSDPLTPGGSGERRPGKDVADEDVPIIARATVVRV
jgi:hypothetical protein